MIGRWGKGDPFPKVSDNVAITFEWSRCHSQQNLTYLANFQGEKFLQKNILPHQLLIFCQYWLDFRTATALPCLQHKKEKISINFTHKKSILFYLLVYQKSKFLFFSSQHTLSHSTILFQVLFFPHIDVCAYSVGQKMKIAVINLWGCDHLDVLGFS